jgi:hypothetical protein
MDRYLRVRRETAKNYGRDAFRRAAGNAQTYYDNVQRQLV